jgi:hypothetical protein
MPRFYLHNRLNERKGQKFAAEASALDRMPAALIPRNAEPIGHISPYPRIDLSPVRSATAQPQVVSAVEESKRIVEAERIWRIVVQVAQGN